MAAMPSNKTSSSSSLAAPPSRSNPNPRNSEISNPMRRSVTGNPFQKPSIIANPRSFNPNTPANSPSDFPRRNSFGGRESVGSFRDLDEKENGKDLKPAKVRSPAASTTKSTKNFMSPTISASSKIAESPRKKVLTERNEPARASFSSTDGKNSTRKVTFADFVEYSDSKPEIVQQENKFQPLSDVVIKEETEKLTDSMVSEDYNGETESSFEPVTSEPDCVNLDPTFRLSPTPPPVSEDFNGETESSFEPVTSKPDCVNLDPTFRLSPTPPPVSSTSTVIAPLDADPLIPPYDPKMNYLSPRPQFLHYRPNPRVELYKERECMKLEDSFSSDTEATEEALSDVSDKSDKESEDVSSNEMVSEEQENVSEPSTITESLTPEEEVVKPGFSVRSKSLIALLLLLSVASITFSITNSPVFDPTAFKDLTIFSHAYDSPEFSKFARANFDRFSESAKANFDELNQNLHIWFTKSMSSISESISTIRGEHTLGHLHYWNLTVLQEENIEVNHFPLFGHGEKLIEEAPQVDLLALNNKENDDSSVTCTDEEEQEVQEEEPVPSILKLEENDTSKEIDTYEEGIEDISVYEEQVQQDMEVITEVENASDAPESEEIVLEEGQSVAAIESEAELSEPNDSESNIDYTEETSDIRPELFEASNLEAKQAPENDASVISEDAEMIHTDDQPDSNSEIHTEVNHYLQLKQGGNSPSVEAVIAASLLLLLSIIAGTTFKWLRKIDEGRRTMATTATINTTSMEKPQLAAKTLHVSPTEQASLDKPFSLRNGPIVMDDVLGESCPSEMSSFQIQNSSSYYSQKVVKEQNEAQSSEMKKPKKNNRRESLASSDYSMGSPSYGSFTTYEKLSSKHGHWEAEMVTPVRRSSRIKNLATSPL